MSSPCYGQEPECTSCGSSRACVEEDCREGHMNPICCICAYKDKQIEKKEMCDECLEELDK